MDYYETYINELAANINIEYFEIIGLFGRYTIHMPFSNKVNIYIGENGLGKTTILNCVYYVLGKKFARLANIPFEEIHIKFREGSAYSITKADVRDYSKRNDVYKRYRYGIGSSKFTDNMIEHFFNMNEEVNPGSISSINQISHELSQRLEIPPSYARELVYEYINEKDSPHIGSVRRKGNKKNVEILNKAISDNISQHIIYLPTYRRIEDDFASLHIQSEELNSTELLIRFGMSDVRKSMDTLLQKIRLSAMESFTSMTGILLKQYTEGIDPKEEMYKNKMLDNIDVNTIEIVLDRVGDEIEETNKKEIIDLIRSGEIQSEKYFYLLNFINKLVDNYDAQKENDDRIKKFADTCNKYLIDKHFYYDQSKLDLNIHLDTVEGEVISLAQLSSGEKQIVSLFSKLYLEENEPSIVIIDEPELSLSIEWQKMLLPDIMHTEKCELLLTVTHSPFIFQNEFDMIAKEMRQIMQME